MPGLATLALLLFAEGAAELFHAGRYAEAERALRARISGKPGDLDARLYLARTLIELNRIPEALVELERLTTAGGPRVTPEAQFQAGLILRQLAERRFHDLERVAPGSAAVLQLGGQRLEQQGNHAAALEQYRAAAKLEPGRPGIHYAIGNLLWRSRELDAALAELQRELGGNPRHGMALLRLGQVLGARGEATDAVVALEGAAQAMPGNADARRELGKAYKNAARLGEARRVWEALAKARPEDEQVHFLLGGLYRAMGEGALAAAAFERHRAVLARRRVR